MKPYAKFGARNSAAYLALPVTFATPSTRLISFPMYLGIASPLRQPARAHQRTDDGSFSQLDFVSVVRERLRVPHRRLSGALKAHRRRQLSGQGRFRFTAAPRLVGNAAEDDARVADRRAVE